MFRVLFHVRRWIRGLSFITHGRSAHAVIYALTGVIFTAGVVAYGLSLWKAPDWIHAKSSVARYDARVLVISIGGAIVVGVGLLYTARNYRLSHRGQVTDRFTKALEQLGSSALYVRIGAIHALEHVMRDSARHQRDVVEVLVAFIRDSAPPSAGRLDEIAEPYTRPTLDIQAALTALARRPPRAESWMIDLRDLYLAGARLRSAKLSNADLSRTNLSQAEMNNADLSGAWLMEANFYNAWLAGSDLSNAQFDGADLRGAALNYADLTRTGFWGTDLQGAHLTNANLYHTSFNRANLAGAILQPGAEGLPLGWVIDPDNGQVTKADESLDDLAQTAGQ